MALASERMSSIPLLNLSKPGTNPFLERSFYEHVKRSYQLPLCFPLEVSPWKNPPLSYFCGSLVGPPTTSLSPMRENAKKGDRGGSDMNLDLSLSGHGQVQIAGYGIEQRRKQGAEITDLLVRLSSVVPVPDAIQSGKASEAVAISGVRSKKMVGSADVKHISPDAIIFDITNQTKIVSFCRDRKSDDTSIELLKLTNEDKELLRRPINSKYNFDSMTEFEYSPLKSQFTTGKNKSNNTLSPQRSPIRSSQRSPQKPPQTLTTASLNHIVDGCDSPKPTSPRGKQHVMLLSPPIRLPMNTAVDYFREVNFANSAVESFGSNPTSTSDLYEEGFQPSHPPSTVNSSSPRMRIKSVERSHSDCNGADNNNFNCNFNIQNVTFSPRSPRNINSNAISTRSPRANDMLSPEKFNMVDNATTNKSTPVRKSVSSTVKGSARKSSVATPYTSSLLFVSSSSSSFSESSLATTISTSSSFSSSSSSTAVKRYMSPVRSPTRVDKDTSNNNSTNSPTRAITKTSTVRSTQKVSSSHGFGSSPSRSVGSSSRLGRSVGTKSKLVQSLRSPFLFAVPDSASNDSNSICDNNVERNIKSRLFSPL